MTHFKKPKSQIINEAKLNAEYAFVQEFTNLKNKVEYGGFFSKEDINKYNHLSIQENLLVRAMSSAIEMAIKNVVENIYTDDEFERDIGLT